MIIKKQMQDGLVLARWFGHHDFAHSSGFKLLHKGISQPSIVFLV